MRRATLTLGIFFPLGYFFHLFVFLEKMGFDNNNHNRNNNNDNDNNDNNIVSKTCSVHIQI